ncbi:hypothetical protein QTP88_014855 [Uroleucon formosanum]
MFYNAHDNIMFIIKWKNIGVARMRPLQCLFGIKPLRRWSYDLFMLTHTYYHNTTYLLLSLLLWRKTAGGKNNSFDASTFCMGTADNMVVFKIVFSSPKWHTATPPNRCETITFKMI